MLGLNPVHTTYLLMQTSHVKNSISDDHAQLFFDARQLTGTLAAGKVPSPKVVELDEIEVDTRETFDAIGRAIGPTMMGHVDIPAPLCDGKSEYMFDDDHIVDVPGVVAVVDVPSDDGVPATHAVATSSSPVYAVVPDIKSEFSTRDIDSLMMTLKPDECVRETVHSFIVRLVRDVEMNKTTDLKKYIIYITTLSVNHIHHFNGYINCVLQWLYNVFPSKKNIIDEIDI
ncbi:hypothetical protein crov156 [Cafeteria roenbergensis virus]|uniref:Uncharacterized protein n=1 Tax=Cafeteria roenbergensis virus (strain BV-PW1) TaxID=693272 RepID=E3T4S6_CROVB|nr:hypothetical protein crov156 [Cafeteria roenbergensis virus BV-PW1]ADO67189.1 hypothetical protein crov156 [Cafeteria roenbergensis virus BV-PW1]